MYRMMTSGRASFVGLLMKSNSRVVHNRSLATQILRLNDLRDNEGRETFRTFFDVVFEKNLFTFLHNLTKHRKNESDEAQDLDGVKLPVSTFRSTFSTSEYIQSATFHR